MQRDSQVPELPKAIAEADKLPTLPAVAFEILQLTRDSDATLDSLAEVISRDPALAAKLLSFANSSRYGLGTEATTLQRAAMVLGLKSVQMLSLSFSLATHLPSTGLSGFDYDAFWSRSLSRAVAGRMLADALTLPFGDEAFLCGLISGIGQLVTVECFPQRYAEVIKRHGTGLPTAKQEQAEFGFRRRDVSFALLQSWGIPEIICMGVLHFEEPAALAAEAPARATMIAELLHVSATAVDVLQKTDKGRCLQELHASARTHLDLGSETIERFLEELGPPISETAQMLGLGHPVNLDSAAIVEEARGQLVRIGMQTAQELETETLHSTAVHERHRITTDPGALDDLTGLPGADAFHSLIASETAARIRGMGRRPLGLILFALDGHGDLERAGGAELAATALRHVATTLQNKLRDSDIVSYLGEARFGILIAECTQFGLKVASERVRRFIEITPLRFRGAEHALTVSLGGATMSSPRELSDGEKLFEITRRLLADARPNTVALLPMRSSGAPPTD